MLKYLRLKQDLQNTNRRDIRRHLYHPLNQHSATLLTASYWDLTCLLKKNGSGIYVKNHFEIPNISDIFSQISIGEVANDRLQAHLKKYGYT
jgi:hypothetical protein